MGEATVEVHSCWASPGLELFLNCQHPTSQMEDIFGLNTFIENEMIQKLKQWNQQMNKIHVQNIPVQGDVTKVGALDRVSICCAF